MLERQSSVAAPLAFEEQHFPVRYWADRRGLGSPTAAARVYEHLATLASAAGLSFTGIRL